MTKQIILTLILTLIFILAIGGFELLHRRAEIEVYSVPKTFLNPVDTQLPVEFVEVLKQHAEEYIGTDLEY